MRLTTRKSGFWKYLLPAGAIIAVALAVMPRHAPSPPYRRFTSPTFPDGVRYTLLYPSSLDDVSLFLYPASYHGKHLKSVGMSKKESRLPGMAQWHRWFRPEAEFVFVTVDNLPVRPLRRSRVDRQGVRNSDEIAHRVYIDDPRAREHFMFGHIDDFGTASYTQDDRVVAASFRILLPGEPVPAP